MQTASEKTAGHLLDYQINVGKINNNYILDNKIVVTNRIKIIQCSDIRGHLTCVEGLSYGSSMYSTSIDQQ